MRSPKTSVAGFAAIVLGVVGLINAIKINSAKDSKDANITTSVSSILSGLGLIFAKDEPLPK